MIYIYGLCYRIVEYADKTINSLRETASEDFFLTCIEAKSCNSNKFYEWGIDSLKSKKIQRFITSSTNCRGYGYNWAIKNFPPDNSEDFLIMTDLDLLIDNFDWIKEIRKKMENNVICGFTLNNKNYVYPNSGWHENFVKENKYFGMWLMAIKTKPFLEILNNMNENVEDMNIINKIKKYGNRDIIDKPLYHLGWDTWKDDKDYWNDKKSCSWQIKYDKYDIEQNPVFKVYEL